MLCALNQLNIDIVSVNPAVAIDQILCSQSPGNICFGADNDDKYTSSAATPSGKRESFPLPKLFISASSVDIVQQCLFTKSFTKSFS